MGLIYCCLSVPDRVKTAVEWSQAEGAEWDAGQRLIIKHFKDLKQVVWHGRGDYLAAVVSEGQNRSVMVHQVSSRRSQIPFNKARGLVQAVQFHPVRPLLFVAVSYIIFTRSWNKQNLLTNKYKKLIEISLADSKIHQDLQPHQATTDQEADVELCLDFLNGRAPRRRQFARWLLRLQEFVVWLGPERQAVPQPSFAFCCRSSRGLPPKVSAVCHSFGRLLVDRLPRQGLQVSTQLGRNCASI